MPWITIIIYLFFTITGSTLVKLGSGMSALLTIPIINLQLSLVSIFGILCYGISFVIYIILLGQLDLSKIAPISVGVVYVLLMITAAIIFKEQFTIQKIIGSLLIFGGVILTVLK